MIDPLSTLSAPPPGYLLESDSSDEEGQGVYGDRQAIPKIRTATSVAVQWLDGPVPASSVIVGVGQAGTYLARRANARMAVLRVEVNGTNAGTGFALGADGEGLLVVLSDRDDKGEAAFEVVERLTASVKAQNWCVFHRARALSSTSE